MADTKTLEYKGHPLRRADKIIYYGSMKDKYIIMLLIQGTTNFGPCEMASKVLVQLQRTEPNLSANDRVVKESTKDSLFAAMDCGSIWLERALAGKFEN